MPELLLDVLGQRLLDLLRAHAVEVDRGGQVAHHRLDLHPVGLGQQLDHALAGLGVGAVEDALVGLFVSIALSLVVARGFPGALSLPALGSLNRALRGRFEPTPHG